MFRNTRSCGFRPVGRVRNVMAFGELAVIAFWLPETLKNTQRSESVKKKLPPTIKNLEKIWVLGPFKNQVFVHLLLFFGLLGPRGLQNRIHHVKIPLGTYSWPSRIPWGPIYDPKPFLTFPMIFFRMFFVIFHDCWRSCAPGALSVGFSMSKYPPGLMLDFLGYFGAPFMTQKQFFYFIQKTSFAESTLKDEWVPIRPLK